MEESTIKPAQISDMFHKFALSLKTKAFEFFSEEDARQSSAGDADGDPETFTLLDFADGLDFDQRVVVIKLETPVVVSGEKGMINSQFNQALISCLFATTSSFEASYLQLQTAHASFNEETIRVTDKALVSHLQTL